MPDYRGISPEVNGGADLGSTTQRWNKLYAQSIDAGTRVNGAFNKKETFTTSGTFVAPVTGVYRITLQGGGGGGGSNGGTHDLKGSSGGGGQGGFGYAYEKLIAGTSYSYVVGAGGPAGTEAGGNGGGGGNTSITVNGNAYVASGGYGGSAGWNTVNPGGGGQGGPFTINGTTVSKGACGTSGGNISTTKANQLGGYGGGPGGGLIYINTITNGMFGGGGAGGNTKVSSDFKEIQLGSVGGDGYIVFEYYDPTA